MIYCKRKPKTIKIRYTETKHTKCIDKLFEYYLKKKIRFKHFISISIVTWRALHLSHLAVYHMIKEKVAHTVARDIL
jgi:hypothetical protein